MSDFKEYKAAFLEQNDLKHYGVKGMKWDHTKRKPGLKIVKPDTKVFDRSATREYIDTYARGSYRPLKDVNLKYYEGPQVKAEQMIRDHEEAEKKKKKRKK